MADQQLREQLARAMQPEVDWSRYNQPFGELKDTNPVLHSLANRLEIRQNDVDQAFDMALGFSGGGLATKWVRNLKNEKIPPPTTFWRGTNPGDSRRISTGKPEWDSHLFAADNKDAALMYGKSLQRYDAAPDARILYENTPEWRSVVGKIAKDENLLEYSARAAQAAKEAGYDAVWFQRQGDVGTAIINPGKFPEGKD